MDTDVYFSFCVQEAFYRQQVASIK